MTINKPDNVIDREQNKWEHGHNITTDRMNKIHDNIVDLWDEVVDLNTCKIIEENDLLYIVKQDGEKLGDGFKFIVEAEDLSNMRLALREGSNNDIIDITYNETVLCSLTIHNHSNKIVIDSITQSDVNNWKQTDNKLSSLRNELDTRITTVNDTLDKKINDNTNTLQGNINSLSDTVEANKTALENTISALNSKVNEDKSTLQINIQAVNDDLDSKITTINTNIDNLNDRIDSNNNEINTINNKLNSNEEWLYWLDDEVKKNNNEINNRLNSNEEWLYWLDGEVKKNTNNYIDVTKYGVVEGLNADVQQNTSAFQSLVDQYKNTHVLYFPAGVFLLGRIDLGTQNNITIKGVSSSFASFMQKSTQDSNIIDTFTKIVCCAETETRTDSVDPIGGGKHSQMFTHNRCMLILEDIAFYNTYEGKGTGLWKNSLFNTSEGTNITKGKLFATNCGFNGFKTVAGDIFTFNYDSIESTPDKLLQCCVMANRCRFTNNEIAINQNVDGRLVDCSFNKNNYAMVFRGSSGFTTANACRIEWNMKHGIYISFSGSDSNGSKAYAHDITITSCEFDRNSFSGLYINGLSGGNFSNNLFRRSGANDTLEIDDKEKNTHMVIKNSSKCILSNNVTISKNTLDSGDGISRPNNVVKATGNTRCIITNNIFTGYSGSSSSPISISDNTNCIITSNIES